MQNPENSNPTKNKIEQIKLSEDANNRIILNSPFYIKRNKIKSTFRQFSKFISKEEAEKLGDRIWNQTHAVKS